jgi:hypothetical protein
MQEMLTASPLGGDIREVGVPTMNARNVDGGCPGRR